MSLRLSRAEPLPALPCHGGPDDGPALIHDFSTNANPLPPPVALVQALAGADRHRYPDPTYSALRAALANTLGREPDRVLPTAGSSEAIRRLSLAAALQGRRQVWVPQPGYGDYAAAAQALGLPVRTYGGAADLIDSLRRDGQAALVWLNEPNNPDGSSWPADHWRPLAELAARCGAWLGLDRAYEPLRLHGSDPVPAAVARQCWQLLSPNKALGCTGIRAGVLIAPEAAHPRAVASVQALAASWVLSAEGQALLQASLLPEVQHWLADARQTLVHWQCQQRQRLSALGWTQRDSVTPFWLAHPGLPAAALPGRLAQLRAAGLKLRDARSFGLPGWVRIATQPPLAQQALAQAWQAGHRRGPPPHALSLDRP